MGPELCGDCEWIEATSYDQHEAQWILGRACPRHVPPPTPLEAARAELDDIDRGTGLADLPGWRRIGRRRGR